MTRIRSHQGGQKVCEKLLVYDANALYSLAMAKDMPYERGKVRVWHVVEELVRGLQDGTWFSFAELNFEIPRPLWLKFENMCPFFVNKEFPERGGQRGRSHRGESC